MQIQVYEIAKNDRTTFCFYMLLDNSRSSTTSLTAIVDWCMDQFGEVEDRWRYWVYTARCADFFIYSEADAALFKLRWC